MVSHLGLKLRNSEVGHKLTSDNFINLTVKDMVYLFSDEVRERSLWLEANQGKPDLSAGYFQSLPYLDFIEEIRKFVSKGKFTEVEDMLYALSSGEIQELSIKLDIVKHKFDLNMKYFESLSHKCFNEEVRKFVDENNFTEVTDLNTLIDQSGYYLMVLDEYCQAYIGVSHKIDQRIKEHWSRKILLSELWMDAKEESGLLAVDCFRALDTTRVFVLPSSKLDYFSDDHMYNQNLENLLIDKFPVDYCLNRFCRLNRESHWEREYRLGVRDAKIYGKSDRLEWASKYISRFQNP